MWNVDKWIFLSSFSWLFSVMEIDRKHWGLVKPSHRHKLSEIKLDQTGKNYPLNMLSLSKSTSNLFWSFLVISGNNQYVTDPLTIFLMRGGGWIYPQLISQNALNIASYCRSRNCLTLILNGPMCLGYFLCVCLIIFFWRDRQVCGWTLNIGQKLTMTTSEQSSWI